MLIVLTAVEIAPETGMYRKSLIPSLSRLYACPADRAYQITASASGGEVLVNLTECRVGLSSPASKTMTVVPDTKASRQEQLTR